MTKHLLMELRKEIKLLDKELESLIGMYAHIDESKELHAQLQKLPDMQFKQTIAHLHYINMPDTIHMIQKSHKRLSKLMDMLRRR